MLFKIIIIVVDFEYVLEQVSEYQCALRIREIVVVCGQ